MGNRMAHDIVFAMNSVKLVILVVLTTLRIGQGDAIQCFVCNSKSDPRCADPIQIDWQSSEPDQDSESNDSNESNDMLFPVECHLAVQYTAGIQAVSDLLRGFGHTRLGLPDLWISTSASLSSNSGPTSANSGGYNKGYGWNGYRGSSATSLNTYGGHRDQDESMGCHKVVYTDSNGNSVVDRGCAPARVANMEPCSALDSATNSDDNGNSGGTGNSGSGSGSGYKNGFGSGHRGGVSGGNFDMSQISPDFCEVCNDDDGCNVATKLNGGNWIFIISILSVLNSHVKSL